MIRAALFALLLGVAATAGYAQQARPSLALPDWNVVPAPAPGDRNTVSGEAVVDLADYLASSLGASGAIPELAQVKTTDGSLRTITAVQAFTLLARTTYLWRTAGELPATVPILPDQVRPPTLDQEDVIAPPSDQTVGREIPTEPFLAQVPAVVRWVDRLQVAPTAVSFEGQRLSAAEYMAGLAICLSYAYWEGGLADTLFLPAYAPPASWMAGMEPAAAAVTNEEEASYNEGQEEEAAPEVEAPRPATSLSAEESGEGYEDEMLSQDEEGDNGYASGIADEEAFWEDSGEEAGDESPAASSSQGEELPALPAKLTVFPEPGATVRGVVDLVASYSGPPPKYVVFTIQGKGDVIMNTAPYSARWDTSALKPGMYQVRIRVFSATDAALADQTTIYSVAPPPPKLDPGKVSGK